MRVYIFCTFACLFFKKMKLLRFVCLFCAAILGSTAMAQSQRELQQLMRNRGEYYFTLSVDDPAQIQTLGEICSVDGTDGRTVVAYANQQEYDKLIALGFKPELQTPPSLREEAKMWEGGDRASYEWDSYLTYPQYVSMMEGFPSQALSDRTCSLIDLGQLATSNHRHLLGVRIYKGEPYGKPKFLYTSTMHGDEVTGMILMLRLIEELCTSTDSRIVNLLNDVDIYIFPCTNPDGTYYGGNNTVTGARRANGNNVDLNRNYKDYFNGDHPNTNTYQDETQWTMALADENLFTMAANYHGGAEVMNYCWDWVFQDHADLDWWEYVCTEYVTLARQVYSSYMTDTYSDGVTNGATWYSITGSRQDYMNAYAQCREVTVECSTTKTPNASQLPSFWNRNHNSMLAFMEQARNGVHGVVYDAQTGQTIQGATVSVMNHDISNSYVTTHSVGDFHRPIKGGTYTFVFDKEDYARKYVEVTVADGQRVDLTVYLSPSSETPTECYTQVDAASIVAGPYLMGYRNGSTLIMPKHDDRSTTTNVSVSSTSLSITPTDEGFTLPHDIDRQRIALEPSGATGQYHIVYKGRMLSRSSGSLRWTKPSNSSGNGVSLTSYRWYVNATGIYQQSGSTKYYLNYSNGSFTTSNTSNQNNILFFMECDCPVTAAEQTVSLEPNWNWWTPTLEMSLDDLEEALDGNAILINSQDEGFARYDGQGWSGTLDTIVPGQMYRILTTAATEFTLSGAAVTSAITILPGYNWFGYTGSQSKNITVAFDDFTPTEGDTITAEDGASATYTNGSWDDNFILTPGHGYVYYSNAQQSRSVIFE